MDDTRAWPELTLSEWEDTRDTLHMWTQVVGKIRMGLTPMINHWWQVALYVSSRGLTTSLMHTGGRGLEIEFDFVEHVLDLRTTDGGRERVPLGPQSVASFYRATMAALDELGVRVAIYPRPSEVVEAIPFDQDEVHRSYDPVAARRFWLGLVQAHRVMLRFRSGFIGKASPVHFFWGGADLATTRFSGRRAPEHRGGVSQLSRLGPSAGIQPRSLELRVLARRWRRGQLLFVRLSGTGRVRRVAGRTGRGVLRRRARRVPVAVRGRAHRVGSRRDAARVLSEHI